MSKKASFYEKLKASLEDSTKFPSNYLFKFIVPTTKDQLKEVKDLFNYGGAVITTKKSKTGKYESISILIKMKSADEIIAKYKEVEKIDGIISL